MPASAWRSWPQERPADRCFPGAGLGRRSLRLRDARRVGRPGLTCSCRRHRHRLARRCEVPLRAAGRGRAGRPGSGRGASAGGAEGGAGEVGSRLRTPRPAVVPPLPVRASGVSEDAGAPPPESAHFPRGLGIPGCEQQVRRPSLPPTHSTLVTLGKDGMESTFST